MLHTVAGLLLLWSVTMSQIAEETGFSTSTRGIDQPADYPGVDASLVACAAVAARGGRQAAELCGCLDAA